MKTKLRVLKEGDFKFAVQAKSWLGKWSTMRRFSSEEVAVQYALLTTQPKQPKETEAKVVWESDGQ